MFLLLFICDGKISFLVTRPLFYSSNSLLDFKVNLGQVSRNEILLIVKPIIILQIIGDRHIKVHPIAYLGIYCLYWFQYSINFFIYAARCEQYRKAYKYFLKNVNISLKIRHNLEFIKKTFQIKRSICGHSNDYKAATTYNYNKNNFLLTSNNSQQVNLIFENKYK